MSVYDVTMMVVIVGGVVTEVAVVTDGEAVIIEPV
jgi:hypothetical protein